MTFPCAIAPLDQNTTSMGWYPGLFVYSSCPATGACGFQDPSLQFLADAGTPVVAPFPVTIVQTSPMFVVRPDPTVPTNGFVIRMTDVTPAAPVGATLQKGDLLGRIAPGKRGTKWVLWGRSANGVTEQQEGIALMFHTLGLEVVGGTRPNLPQYTTISSFGGRLLAQTGSPAACSSTGAMHGLAGLSKYLGSAPTGYQETPSSIYSRYGTSAQSDRSVPNPHENVSPTRAQVAGGGAALLVAGLGLAWWMRNG